VTRITEHKESKTKKRRKRHNRLMHPRKATMGLLSRKSQSIFGETAELEDLEEGMWNTGEWRAVGVGRAKRTADESRAVDPVAEGEAPLPPRPKAIRPALQRGKIALIVAATLVLVVLGMAQVWVRLRIVRMGYELSTESARQTRLERLHQKLSVEHALLRNPRRLRRVARERLGLRSPNPQETRRIQKASSLFGAKVAEKQ
jgi:cell division protein FtsL